MLAYSSCVVLACFSVLTSSDFKIDKPIIVGLGYGPNFPKPQSLRPAQHINNGFSFLLDSISKRLFVSFINVINVRNKDFAKKKASNSLSKLNSHLNIALFYSEFSLV